MQIVYLVDQPDIANVRIVHIAMWGGGLSCKGSVSVNNESLIESESCIVDSRFILL